MVSMNGHSGNARRPQGQEGQPPQGQAGGGVGLATLKFGVILTCCSFDLTMLSP